MSEKAKVRDLPQWMTEEREEEKEKEKASTTGGQKARKFQYVMSPRELEAAAREALEKDKKK